MAPPRVGRGAAHDSAFVSRVQPRQGCHRLTRHAPPAPLVLTPVPESFDLQSRAPRFSQWKVRQGSSASSHQNVASGPPCGPEFSPIQPWFTTGSGGHRRHPRHRACHARGVSREHVQQTGSVREAGGKADLCGLRRWRSGRGSHRAALYERRTCKRRRQYYRGRRGYPGGRAQQDPKGGGREGRTGCQDCIGEGGRGGGGRETGRRETGRGGDGLRHQAPFK